MKFTPTSLLLVSIMLVSMIFSGCTQLPTETSSIVDIRPSVAFQATNSKVYQARVLVDGLDMGEVGEYLVEKNKLRVLPGSHLLLVLLGNEILLEEKFYLGDGAYRTFIVK